MIFPLNSLVQSRDGIGRVRRVLASGHAYKVEFFGLGEVVCLACVLTPAPENVAMFRKPTEEQRQWL